MDLDEIPTGAPITDSSKDSLLEIEDIKPLSVLEPSLDNNMSAFDPSDSLLDIYTPDGMKPLSVLDTSLVNNMSAFDPSDSLLEINVPDDTKPLFVLDPSLDNNNISAFDPSDSLLDIYTPDGMKPLSVLDPSLDSISAFDPSDSLLDIKPLSVLDPSLDKASAQYDPSDSLRAKILRSYKLTPLPPLLSPAAISLKSTPSLPLFTPTTTFIPLPLTSIVSEHNNKRPVAMLFASSPPSLPTSFAAVSKAISLLSLFKASCTCSSSTNGGLGVITSVSVLIAHTSSSLCTNTGPTLKPLWTSLPGLGVFTSLSVVIAGPTTL
eukprot:CAMPEP_0184343320 /NCGR_PEP_ID=MMETSP1089-20130417/11856_1 /TAXON_ID=38269 ORGANISM="Gloeochaete wittrockiana, Strain SAG46.84" /NCGR_SAMPLE_ID=MMETSP1089 /ASSEMBLY_ACC=CAM_ASM_000445 /LENGTH=321 /DNA_ID=CAMNT_0026672567 /DNA_START=162 /DNA_END=1127 /DNA_ORIENTATION=-